MSDPKGFMKFQRETPSREPAATRVRHFQEFYKPFSEESLKVQGARCMDCGVPFCQGSNGCPVENLIPEFNDLVHMGKWREALRALHSTNNFPEFTGKLCPAPCESACTLGISEDPVTIRTLESSIIDRGFDEGWVQPKPAPKLSGKKVAVVGSGPAGLAAAQQLARAGHEVTVFEKADRPGGLLRYGIPDFKMEKWVLERRLEQLQAEGVAFRTGSEIGVGDLQASQLLNQFDAVCLAMGAEEPRDLNVPGRELKGVVRAMDFLTEQNRRIAGDDVSPISSGLLTAKGKRVVILGGGDTGSDCLGTVLRQGCVSVHQFELMPQPPTSRAGSTPWPLWPMQLRSSHAHEEGGLRDWSVSTTSLEGEGGVLKRLNAGRVKFEGGRFEPIPGTELSLECDLLLLAMGFTGPSKRPSTDAIVQGFGLERDGRGNIATDLGFRTKNPKVFAAGDIRRGASLIVWAIAEGRKMAAAVDRFLGSNAN